MRKIIINRWDGDTRGAVLENGKVTEWLFDGDRHLPGTVIKGKVADVLPGMDAAFVDIGSGKNGFLYKKELVWEPDEDPDSVPVTSKLVKGQSVLVQVKKEEAGQKGAKLTEQLSFPGKYIVYLPRGGYVAVSKKMRTEETREEWRGRGKDWTQDGEGVIFRTLAQDASAEEVEAELKSLRQMFRRIEYEAQSAKGSITVLYNEATVLARVERDFLSDPGTEIEVDDPGAYKYLTEIVSAAGNNKVSLYQGKENIFSYYELDQAVDKALKPFVWLKNGGSLHINFTEALTVIDVNSARFTGKQGLRDTALKINIEAAHAIASEIRLREIGGIILIDFIDMHEEEDREQVLAALTDACKKDRTITNVLGFTQLGLVEMTRKRTRQSLDETLREDCDVCRGSGRVTKTEETAREMEMAVYSMRHLDGDAAVISVNRKVAGLFRNEGNKRIKRLKEKAGKIVFLVSQEESGFQILFCGSKTEAEGRLERMMKDGIN